MRLESEQSLSHSVSLALVFMLIMMGTTLPTPLYPLYQQVFDISELVITAIYAVYAFGVIAAALVVGRLSDQIGRRPVLGAGLLMSAISAGFLIWGANIEVLLVGRVLSGLSAGIFTSVATVAVIELAPASWADRATLVATAANMGGLGLGPIFAGMASQLLPWPLQLCYVLHALMIAASALVIARAPETVARPSRPRFAIQIPRVPAPARPTFIPAAIAGFAGFAVLGLFAAVAPAIMGDILSIDNRIAVGAVVAVMFAASTAGQLGQATLPAAWRLPTGCIGLILGMFCVGLSLLWASLGWLITGAVVGGISQGIAFRAGLRRVTAASPAERRSEVASMFFIVVYVAISLPVVGLGLSAVSFGLVAGGLAFTAVVMLLALASLVALIAARSRRFQTA